MIKLKVEWEEATVAVMKLQSLRKTKKKLLTIRTSRLEKDIWIWELSKYEIGVLTDLMEMFLVENKRTRDLNKGTSGCSGRENKVTIKERDLHR